VTGGSFIKTCWRKQPAVKARRAYLGTLTLYDNANRKVTEKHRMEDVVTKLPGSSSSFQLGKQWQGIAPTRGVGMYLAALRAGRLVKNQSGSCSSMQFHLASISAGPVPSISSQLQ